MLNRVHIDRDPANKLKEQQVLQQMQHIIQQHAPQPETRTNQQTSVEFVGMEQALRELMELEKKIT